jgi:hypothetical protein
MTSDSSLSRPSHADFGPRLASSPVQPALFRDSTNPDDAGRRVGFVERRAGKESDTRLRPVYN